MIFWENSQKSCYRDEGCTELGLDDKRQLIKKGKSGNKTEISAGIVRRRSFPDEISLFSQKKLQFNSSERLLKLFNWDFFFGRSPFFDGKFIIDLTTAQHSPMGAATASARLFLIYA